MKRSYICTTSLDDTGKKFKPVVKKTEKGVSAYANAMYGKYGDKVNIEVGYFDEDIKWVPVATYHA